MTFRAGDPVTTIARELDHHTRLPRYLRAKSGVIESVHGEYPLADERAAGRLRPEPLYTVAFRAADVWESPAEPNATLHAELWESYLVPR